MSSIKELRAQLKKLNGLQYHKKVQLRWAITQQAKCQQRINLKRMVDPLGTKYIPEYSLSIFNQLNRTISRLTKDMNRRRYKIRMLESQVEQIKMAVSKDAYFQDIQDGVITGLHAVGFKGPNGEFYQEEIWANIYEKQENGILKMRGGSLRVSGPFDEVVEDFKNDPSLIQVEGKLK